MRQRAARSASAAEAANAALQRSVDELALTREELEKTRRQVARAKEETAASRRAERAVDAAARIHANELAAEVRPNLTALDHDHTLEHTHHQDI